MTDIVDKKTRSRIMASIRSKDTAPEKAVRSLLHRMGFRFRLHNKALPGKPDICLPRYKTVIFVHGCFWHRHAKCRDGRLPKSNLGYWAPKIEKNVLRDKKRKKELKRLGWKVITIWECETKNMDLVQAKIARDLRR